MKGRLLLKKQTLIGLLIALLILVLAVAAMIFFFSAQDKDQSSDTSKIVTQRLLERFYPDYDQLTKKQKRVLLRQYQPTVRKTAHVLEFMLLGALLFLLVHGLKARWAGLIAWITGTLYAVTDEIHQTAVSGRAGRITDVGFDSGGVLLGILLGLLLLRLFRRIFEKGKTAA